MLNVGQISFVELRFQVRPRLRNAQKAVKHLVRLQLEPTVRKLSEVNPVLENRCQKNIQQNTKKMCHLCETREHQSAAHNTQVQITEFDAANFDMKVLLT